MGRGESKHLKRLAAPRHWMLDRISGHFAPKPRSGPHSNRESIPLLVILRNRIKYAFTRDEVQRILKCSSVRLDGKVRTHPSYPAGLMDVLSLDPLKQHFRVLYDAKGRFTFVRIDDAASKWKLCRVIKRTFGARRVPYIHLHDGRTLRYPEPGIKVHDTIKLQLGTNQILETLPLRVNAWATVTAGRNRGRVGQIMHIERHPGISDVVKLVDARKHPFSTQIEKVFVIGQESPAVSLPSRKGVRQSNPEDRERKLRIRAQHQMPKLASIVGEAD